MADTPECKAETPPSAPAASPSTEAVAAPEPAGRFARVKSRLCVALDLSGACAAALRHLPSRRSIAFAGAFTLTAGLSLLIGAAGAPRVAPLFASPAMAKGGQTELQALKRTVAQIEKQVAGLKAGMERSARLARTERGKIADRFDRVARAQTDMQTSLQAQLSNINDAVGRLDKRMASAAADITGSITAQQHAEGAAKLEKTTSKEVSPPIVEGWTVRDVFRGTALVESRHGMYQVVPGLRLPGLGEVQSIERRHGRWVVVTPKGLIVASRSIRGDRYPGWN